MKTKACYFSAFSNLFSSIFHYNFQKKKTEPPLDSNFVDSNSKMSFPHLFTKNIIDGQIKNQKKNNEETDLLLKKNN